MTKTSKQAIMRMALQMLARKANLVRRRENIVKIRKMEMLIVATVTIMKAIVILK